VALYEAGNTVVRAFIENSGLAQDCVVGLGDGVSGLVAAVIWRGDAALVVMKCRRRYADLQQDWSRRSDAAG